VAVCAGGGSGAGLESMLLHHHLAVDGHARRRAQKEHPKAFVVSGNSNASQRLFRARDETVILSDEPDVKFSLLPPSHSRCRCPSMVPSPCCTSVCRSRGRRANSTTHRCDPTLSKWVYSQYPSARPPLARRPDSTPRPRPTASRDGRYLTILTKNSWALTSFHSNGIAGSDGAVHLHNKDPSHISQHEIETARDRYKQRERGTERAVSSYGIFRVLFGFVWNCSRPRARSCAFVEALPGAIPIAYP